MQSYKFIICGAGLSGMVLAHFLTKEFPTSSILIIEKNRGKFPFKRMWSYWIQNRHPFEEVVKKSWNSFGVYTPTMYKNFNLEKYRFELINSDDLFSYIKNTLANYSVECKFEQVEKVSTVEGKGIVQALQGGRFRADWVFDSTADGDQTVAPLYIQGWGWEVSLSKSVFNEKELIFQDFRLKLPDLAFFYVMPISDKQAFIDSASFNMGDNSRSSELDGQKLIKNYLEKCWGVKEYKIRSSKFEQIPLNLNERLRCPSARVINIGIKGGLVNPTTSYGFVPILKDTELIISWLKKGNVPFFGSQRSLFNRFIDRLMYNAIRNRPGDLLPICSQMFERSISGEGDRVLGFLSGDNSLFQNIMFLRNKEVRLFMKIFKVDGI